VRTSASLSPSPFPCQLPPIPKRVEVPRGARASCSAYTRRLHQGIELLKRVHLTSCALVHLTAIWINASVICASLLCSWMWSSTCPIATATRTFDRYVYTFCWYLFIYCVFFPCYNNLNWAEIIKIGFDYLDLSYIYREPQSLDMEAHIFQRRNIMSFEWCTMVYTILKVGF